jgi:hypothetical protein
MPNSLWILSVNLLPSVKQITHHNPSNVQYSSTPIVHNKIFSSILKLKYCTHQWILSLYFSTIFTSFLSTSFEQIKSSSTYTYNMYTYYKIEMVKNKIINWITKKYCNNCPWFYTKFTPLSIFAKTHLKINFSLDWFSSLKFHDM